MARFLLGRLAQTLFSLLALTLVIFLLVRFTGDPTRTLIAPDAPPEVYENARAALGLDDPLWIQYGRYLVDVLTGNFGTSFSLRVPVSELISERLRLTLQLGLTALIIAVSIGIPAGVLAARRRDSRFDRIVRALAAVAQSAPSFWVGLMLILVFSVQLDLLPGGGANQGLRSLILPGFTLSLFTMAGLARLMRSSLLDTLETDYIRFCRIRGLSERSVLWRHGVRNASLPVLTFGGILVSTLVTGAVVTEVVFNWPGLGQLLVQSITSRDFPVVQGLVLVLGCVYIMMNLVVDIAYMYLNPRIRRG